MTRGLHPAIGAPAIDISVPRLGLRLPVEMALSATDIGGPLRSPSGKRKDPLDLSIANPAGEVGARARLALKTLARATIRSRRAPGREGAQGT
jgi:hypothetical protein